jgi:hypothetical protein
MDDDVYNLQIDLERLGVGIDPGGSGEGLLDARRLRAMRVGLGVEDG